MVGHTEELQLITFARIGNGSSTSTVHTRRACVVKSSLIAGETEQ